MTKLGFLECCSHAIKHVSKDGLGNKVTNQQCLTAMLQMVGLVNDSSNWEKYRAVGKTDRACRDCCQGALINTLAQSSEIGGGVGNRLNN
jgi:hypothetical protein